MCLIHVTSVCDTQSRPYPFHYPPPFIYQTPSGVPSIQWSTSITRSGIEYGSVPHASTPSGYTTLFGARRTTCPRLREIGGHSTFGKIYSSISRPRLACQSSHIIVALVSAFFCAFIQFRFVVYLMPRFTLLTVLTDKLFRIERWKRCRLAKNETDNSILIA